MKEILENYVKNPSDEGYSRDLVEALEASRNSDELKHLINIVIDCCGRTALKYAAINGHERVVRLLIEKGAEVNKADSYGFTALTWAAMYGNESIVCLLIEKGADISKVGYDGDTALLCAAHGGFTEIVRLLIERGAEVNKANNKGATALHDAAMMGQESVARLLIEKGAEVNKADQDGKTALQMAAMSGHASVARLLIENGAEVNNVDKTGCMALSSAAFYGHTETVRLLLLCGGELGQVMDRDAAKINETIKAAQSENDQIAIAENSLDEAAKRNEKTLLNPQNGSIVGDVLGLVKLFMNNNISPTTLPVEQASRLREQGAKTAADAARGI